MHLIPIMMEKLFGEHASAKEGLKVASNGAARRTEVGRILPYRIGGNPSRTLAAGWLHLTWRQERKSGMRSRPGRRAERRRVAALRRLRPLRWFRELYSPGQWMVTCVPTTREMET